MPPTESIQSQEPKPSKLKPTLLIVLAILLVSGLSIAAFFIGKDKGESKTNQEVTIQTDQSTEEDSSRETNTQKGQYLEIEEIGVRLKLPSTITDAYFVKKQNFSEDDSDTYFVSTQTLKKLDSGCSAEDESRLAPARIGTFTDPNQPYGIGDDTTISQFYPNNLKIDSRYVFYTTQNQSTCYPIEEYDSAKGSQINEIFDAFDEATLEAL